MDPSFWKGKRVFLTGHSGFKGSWLSLMLQEFDAEITGFALAPPTNPNLFELANVADGMAVIEGDIRDISAIKMAVSDAKPEIVIHMAAQPLVRNSYQFPVDTFSTNIMGTINLFEAIRECPTVCGVVNVTTDKCYENKEWVWGYRENEAMGGSDPYSASKACAEIVSTAYQRSFFSSPGSKVVLATARAGNVIGGGDWAKDRLMTDLLAAYSKGKPALIRNPNSIRPWQHVLESLNGYLMLAQALCSRGSAFSGAWNFGPLHEDAKSVSWVADELSRHWERPASWKPLLGKHPHEANYLKLDISKSQDQLGWRPGLTLEQALKLTAEWTQQVANGKSARAITLEQIRFYQEKV
jgi:CDP-glucose 4,6-dehydratase